MSDLIQRLRDGTVSGAMDLSRLMLKAADEIERLTADNKWAGEQLIKSGEVYRAEIERLSALVALQRKDMKQAMDDNQRLEDAMRQIQATTSDKAVQSITDEALCFITEQEGET